MIDSKIIVNKGNLPSSDISDIYKKIDTIDIHNALIVVTHMNILEIYTSSRIKFKLKRVFKNKIIEHTRLGLYTVYDIDVDNYNKYIIEI
jgi:hypothetical protein